MEGGCVSQDALRLIHVLYMLDALIKHPHHFARMCLQVCVEAQLVRTQCVKLYK